MSMTWMQRQGWHFVSSLISALVALLTAWILFYGQVQVTARDVAELKRCVEPLEERVRSQEILTAKTLSSIDEQLIAIRLRLDRLEQ